MSERIKFPVGATVFSKKSATKNKDGSDYLLKQILVYLGQDGTSFSLGYREFGDGQARAAFNEKVRYQNPVVGMPTEISFRRARMKVHFISNSAIDIETLSGGEQI